MNDDDFDKFLATKIKDMVLMYRDVKQLYNLSESEVHCMTHMLQVLQGLGYSAELTIKLLKALSTLMSMIEDKVNTEKRNK